MTMRSRLRTSALLAAMAAGLPALMAGCFAGSEDKLGSGYASGTGAPSPIQGQPFPNKTEEVRGDKGIDRAPSNTRADDGDRTKTGGLGTGSHALPGQVGSRSGTPDNTGPK